MIWNGGRNKDGKEWNEITENGKTEKIKTRYGLKERSEKKQDGIETEVSISLLILQDYHGYSLVQWHSILLTI